MGSTLPGTPGVVQSAGYGDLENYLHLVKTTPSHRETPWRRLTRHYRFGLSSGRAFVPISIVVATSAG